MPKIYRSVPIEIEAVQFDGNNFDEIQNFAYDRPTIDGELTYRQLFRPVPLDRLRETDAHFPYEPGVVAEVFDTLHDTWVGVKANQWIIKGTRGEFYPCDDEVFKQKYEEL